LLDPEPTFHSPAVAVTIPYVDGFGQRFDVNLHRGGGSRLYV
jgi:hypothetical protein